MVAGVAAVAICCLGFTLLLAVGGGVVASIVFGSWGIVLALVGITAWGVWRYRRRRSACDVESHPSTEQKHRG